MKPVVYVDIDDVLCETAQRLMLMTNARYGRSIRYDQITTFNLEEAFCLNADQCEALSTWFHDPAVLTGLEPVADAAATLGRWRDAGVEIDIVTGRPPVTAGPTEQWLRAQGIPYDRLFFMDKYARGNQPVPGTEMLTAETLRARPYALAIDDAVPMIRFFAEETAVPMVIFDRPWNRACTEAMAVDNPASLHRCRSWVDIQAVAGRLLGG